MLGQLIAPLLLSLAPSHYAQMSDVMRPRVLYLCKDRDALIYIESILLQNARTKASPTPLWW